MGRRSQRLGNYSRAGNMFMKGSGKFSMSGTLPRLMTGLPQTEGPSVACDGSDVAVAGCLAIEP